MQIVILPGYQELFGAPHISYTEYVQHVPSEIIISLFIAINNELNAPHTIEENQKRLKNLISRNFSQEQLKKLNEVFAQYMQKTKGNYKGDIFGKHYLIGMILKELNNYRSFDFTDTTGNDEYNILMAYFLTVDEINEKQRRLLDESLLHIDDPNYIYRMIWGPNINQYEFNEDIDLGYEYFRSFALMKYALDHLKIYLIEYLKASNFNSIGQLFGSTLLVSKTTLNYNSDKLFKKLNFITPNFNELENLHLDQQSINSKIGIENIDLASLRKRPLFRHSKNGFMIIDNDIYNKRSYKGPFFELYYNTSLKLKNNFSTYCSDIPSKVLEKKCFQTLMSTLANSKHDFIHFDDATDNIPDCYIRRSKKILLCEFKGYLFSDDLSSNPSFEKIKEYIDKRYLENEKGKIKGVRQIIKQLEILMKNEFSFDRGYHEKSLNIKITIFPIIVHTEFHMTMPGINEYLNSLFQSNLSNEVKTYFSIMPLMFINLNTIFDLVLRGGTFTNVELLIKRYLNIITSRKKKFEHNPSIDTHLKSLSSFDEIYRTIFQKDLLNVPKGKLLQKKVSDLVEITQEELDTLLY